MFFHKAHIIFLGYFKFFGRSILMLCYEACNFILQHLNFLLVIIISALIDQNFGIQLFFFLMSFIASLALISTISLSVRRRSLTRRANKHRNFLFFFFALINLHLGLVRFNLKLSLSFFHLLYNISFYNRRLKLRFFL